MHQYTFSPVTVARATAGRKSMIAMRPNWKRMKYALANSLVGRLKRLSRYSYAVVTRSRR